MRLAVGSVSRSGGRDTTGSRCERHIASQPIEFGNDQRGSAAFGVSQSLGQFGPIIAAAAFNFGVFGQHFGMMLAGMFDHGGPLAVEAQTDSTFEVMKASEI